MLSLKELPARGLQSALGGFLLCLAFASDFSYPALNTYLISYMRSTGRNPGLSYSDFLILSNCKVLVQGLSMPLVGALTARLGCTASLTIGSTIYCAGFLLTFLTCQSVFPLAVLSLASHGLAFSFCYATAVGAAMQWFPARRRGLAGSIVLSGYGFGSLLWVPAMTLLVNPDNVAAQVEPGCSGPDCQLYFTDPTLLARVPNMFLVLGSVFAALCLAAVLLISEPAEGETDGENEEKIKEVQRSQEDTESIPLISREPYSLSPKQVLRTPLFYQIWLGFFGVYLTNGLMGSYSKTFGMTFINDDQYYAVVAVFFNILNGLCRIFWGLAYDRLGFRTCFLTILVVVVAVTAGLPLLPLLPHNSTAVKLCYALLLGALYFTFPGVYSLVAAAVRDGFGPAHYKANFGLLFTVSAAYCGLTSLLAALPALSSALGYTGLFLMAGCCGLLSLAAVAPAPSPAAHNHKLKLRSGYEAI